MASATSRNSRLARRKSRPSCLPIGGTWAGQTDSNGHVEKTQQPGAGVRDVEVQRGEDRVAVTAADAPALHGVSRKERPARPVEKGTVAPGMAACFDYVKTAVPDREGVAVPEQDADAGFRDAQAGQEVPVAGNVERPRVIVPEAGPLAVEGLYPRGICEGGGNASVWCGPRPGALTPGVVRVAVGGRSGGRLWRGRGYVAHRHVERRRKRAADASGNQGEAVTVGQEIGP